MRYHSLLLLVVVSLVGGLAYGESFNLTIQYVEHTLKGAETSEQVLDDLVQGKIPATAVMETLSFDHLPANEVTVERESSSAKKYKINRSEALGVKNMKVSCTLKPATNGCVSIQLEMNVGEEVPFLVQQRSKEGETLSQRTRTTGLILRTSAELQVGSRSIVHSSVGKTGQRTVGRYVIVSIERAKS